MADRDKAKEVKRASHDLAQEALLRTSRRSRDQSKYRRKQKHRKREELDQDLQE